MDLVKLYAGKLIRDAILLESSEVFKLFVVMLALADHDGEIECGGAKALSRLSALPLDSVKEALHVLESPDPDSSPEEGGRRVVRTGDGWRIVSIQRYREIRSKGAERVARHRARKMAQRTGGSV